MKLFLLPFLICLNIVATAQAPIITSADMPNILDTFRYSIVANPVLLNPAPTDTNFIWDYSSLSASSQYIDTFRSPSSTNIAFAFIFSGADLALNFSFLQTIGTVQVSNIYNFYNKTTTNFESMGFGTILNGIPIPVVYTSPDVIYSFPLTYGNVDSSNSTFTITLPTLGTVHRTQTRTNFIDGWGTLILPSGSHQVLRIRSEIESEDSITGLSLAIPTSTIEYKWISKSSKVPLLEIVSTNSIITRAVYRDNYLFMSNVKELMNVTSSSIYPNPAKNTLFFKNPKNITEPVKVEIFNLKGQLVHIEKGLIQDNNFTVTVDISTIQNGTYIIKATSGGEVYNQKLVILKD